MLKIFTTNTNDGLVAIESNKITKIITRTYTSGKSEGVIIFGNGTNPIEFWIGEKTLLDIIDFINSDEIEFKVEVD